jgi:orotidine-5'-phosphate decarboxylase
MSDELTPEERLIVAMDMPYDDALALAPHLKSAGVKLVKFGLRTIYEVGPHRPVEDMSKLGLEVFLDGKIHDIADPTIREAARNIDQLVKPWMFNVMASGEVDMMMATAAQANRSRVAAVTVLTSLDDEEAFLAHGSPTAAKVLQYARNAKLAGIKILICSPLEAAMIAKHPEVADLLVFTPGIRPEWSASVGQSRFTTPRQAIHAGATCVIVGSPVTNPPDVIGSPERAVELIFEDIRMGYMDREAVE